MMKMHHVILTLILLLTSSCKLVNNDEIAFTSKMNSDTETANLPMINVLITGSIYKPGLYHLPDGSNLGDAVDAAGGLAPKGDLGAKPYRVRIFSRRQRDQSKFIQIKDNDNWHKEPLRDGDALHFPLVVF